MNATMTRLGAVGPYAGGAFVLCAAAVVATVLAGRDDGAEEDEAQTYVSAAAVQGTVPSRPARPEPGPGAIAEKRHPGHDADLAPPILDPPVLGVRLHWIRDNFGERRGARRHAGVDILAAHGTPALAAVDGWIWQMKWDDKGGRMLYLLESSRRYLLGYAHLDAYAPDMVVGRPVRRGEVVGYIGETGNAAGSPHLHLSVIRIRSPERWWDGVAVDPYPLLLEGLVP
ncbi:MAG: M23 family metallopeptidase [Gemmatimonadota bacterium]